MPVPWDFAEGSPIWRQIAVRIKSDVAGGRLAPGEKIASVRDLAVQAGVNPNTMQRALAQLEQEGILRTERTSGRYVTEDAAVLDVLRGQLASGIIADLYRKLRAIGMDDDQIVAAVAAWKDEG
ncbi:GntR family transcriptional regulator [Olsenella uli]|uniref:GntR family transcriptional regulator n=1 Tax=Olsenella uli TaxID=133926 RepID=UPI0012AB8528|nr:GntR family transcriptional regulator [Olsenella uli]